MASQLLLENQRVIETFLRGAKQRLDSAITLGIGRLLSRAAHPEGVSEVPHAQKVHTLCVQHELDRR